jgi:hypothetical protein
MKTSIQCARTILLLLGAAMLGVCASSAQVIGLQPTPIGVYTFNTSTGDWDAATSSSTAEPLSTTPQAFAFYFYNATLGQWVPCTNLATCLNGGASSVTSVSNTDGTLTISPTTGDVVASLALGHANTWTGKQSQPAPLFTDLTGSTQCLHVDTTGQVSGTGSDCGSGGGGGVGSGVVPEIPYYSSTTGVQGDPYLFDFANSTLTLGSAYSLTGTISESSASVVTITLSGGPTFPASATGFYATMVSLPSSFSYLDSVQTWFTGASGSTITLFDPTLHGTQASVAASGTAAITGTTVPASGVYEANSLNYTGGANFTSFAGADYNWITVSNGGSQNGSGSLNFTAINNQANGTAGGNMTFTTAQKGMNSNSGNISFIFAPPAPDAALGGNGDDFTIQFEGFDNGNSDNVRVISEAAPDDNSGDGNIFFDQRCQPYTSGGVPSGSCPLDGGSGNYTFENSFVFSGGAYNGFQGDDCVGCFAVALDGTRYGNVGESDGNLMNNFILSAGQYTTSPFNCTTCNSYNYSLYLGPTGNSSLGAGDAGNYSVTTNVQYTVLSGLPANANSGNVTFTLSNPLSPQDANFDVVSTGPMEWTSANGSLSSQGQLKLSSPVYASASWSGRIFSPWTVAWPQSVVSGDLLIVTYSAFNVTSTPSLSDSLGTSFSIAANNGSTCVAASTQCVFVFAGLASASGADTLTVGTPKNNADSVSMMEVRGATTTVDASAQQVTSTASPALSVTTTVANDFVYYTTQAPSNWCFYSTASPFQMFSQGGTGNADWGEGFGIQAAAGTATATLTITGSNCDSHNTQLLVAFESANSGAAPAVFAGQTSANVRTQPGLGSLLAACSASTVGEQANVTDAASPLPGAAYTSGGSFKGPVACTYNGSSYSWVTLFGPGAGGSGTVTSVAMTMPGVLFNSIVPGSPITTSGTLAPTLATQSANVVLAGPSSGSAATPTFRALVAADLPAVTNLAGGAVGSLPYQSAASTTAFIASPTTSGHTFVPAWQPFGSAIAPAALDLATYLASPPAIGGTTPAAINGTTLTATTGMKTADGSLTTGGYGFSTLTAARIYTNGSNQVLITADGVNSTEFLAGFVVSPRFATSNNGSASTPSYQSTGGNNGLYFPSTNTNAFTCGGTSCATFSSTLATFPAVAVATARKGTFVCTAGGTITISNTNELATSDVVISLNTAGGTISTPPAMKTVTAGTGFTALCASADTSTYNYDILN